MNWEIFFRLYNERLSEAFDSAMDGTEDESRLGDPDFNDALRNDVLNSMQAWYTTPHAGLGGLAPECMIDAITDLDEAVRIFCLAAVRCDDDIPEYLKIRLGSFGVSAADRMAGLALETAWESTGDGEGLPSEEILCASMALKLLGEWGMEQSLDAVTDKFIASANPAEFIADAFKSYIEGIGAGAAAMLVRKLNDSIDQSAEFTMAHEYALIALTSAGRTDRDDVVFSCIRRCFRNMEHKVIGAVCLGDYGDARGITVLKGFLDNSDNKPDRQLFYEILSSIRRLGGEIHDIKDPFGDFSLKR
ncbi:MAG: hypothetical protein ACYCYM_14225 [Saccharofermentanales bacterium]